ncbi:MAG: hypothetical protein HKO98_12350 [Gemmatimonadetes bacterium]|nr:hypothetical protein [Gemmatimonadota bacterium]
MPTLAERLSALRAEKDAARDPAATALMNRATDELRASGILDGVLGPGDRAPRFARPDVNGDVVRLDGLLRKGPVIASFFRGRW